MHVFSCHGVEAPGAVRDPEGVGRLGRGIGGKVVPEERGREFGVGNEGPLPGIPPSIPPGRFQGVMRADAEMVEGLLFVGTAAMSDAHNSAMAAKAGRERDGTIVESVSYSRVTAGVSTETGRFKSGLDGVTIEEWSELMAY